MGSQDTVRTAFLHDAFDIRIEQGPAPDVLPGHVAIRPEFCGICGSDMHFYLHKEMAEMLKAPHPLTGSGLPNPLGHEFAGIITEIGPDGANIANGADYGPLAVGDRVAVMPIWADGTCWACQNGHSNVCSQLGFIGIHGKTGGMGDRAIVPSHLVFKLPKSIKGDVGALIEPLSVAWHALGILGSEAVKSAKAVLILGGGAVGTAVLLCLLAHGVTNIIVSEPSSAKREFSARLGAKLACHPSEVADAVAKLTSSRGGVDAVFDCAGVETSLDTAVQCVRTKGTIINLALQVAPTIPLFAMVQKEIRLECSLAYNVEDYRAVIAAIESGAMKPESLITKRIPLASLVDEGFEALHVRDNSECKILVDMAL